MRKPRVRDAPDWEVYVTAEWRYRLTVAVLVLVLGIVVFANSWGTFTADIKPEVYLAPEHMWHRFLSSWLWSPSLGYPNFNVGLAPTMGIVALLRWIGLEPELAYKVFHFAMWLVGAAGAARLTRDLTQKAGRWAPLAAAVVFLANPYTVSAGATLAIALPLCLLPWQLVTLIRGLREPHSWRWPAAFGVTWFFMSGMNVAVVPTLQLVSVAAVVWGTVVTGRTTWWVAFGVVSRSAIWVVLLSLYWLVPSLYALRTGSQVVQSSETLEGIHQVSSLSEVARGMGLWFNYGRGATGEWVPGFAAYISQPLVILLTALLPVLALVAMRYGTRRLVLTSAALVATATVVMVGAYPGRGSSPFGAILAWLLEEVPALSAFRTTNKIGALLVLGYALLIGSLVARIASSLRSRAVGATAALLAGGLIVVWAYPAFTGRLYPSEVEIPDYWSAAADAMNDGDPDARVLFLPGQVRAAYRWTSERPDDLMNSLIRRPATVPETTSGSSPTAGNFLASLDDSVQSASAGNQIVSLYARYLGADQVLLRHDTVWEDRGGASPAVMEQVVSGDPGLHGLGNFGEHGENVFGGTAGPGYAEYFLSPLQLYGVHDWRPMVSAYSSNGVIVAGDGWSLPAMQRADLLGGDPLFRYAHDLDAATFAESLDDTQRLVLTDTNRRRDVISNRLTSGHSALRAESDVLTSERSLGSAADQTVLVRSGATVTASQMGGAFFDLPFGVPDNAFDGRSDTAWLFGDFQRGVGAQLVIVLPDEVPLGEVSVEQPTIGPVEIDSVRIQAGSSTHEVQMPESGPATIDFGDVAADSVVVTITGLRGDGFNSVGVSEVAIEGATAIGAEVRRVARLPETFVRHYEQASAMARTAFESTPLDVLMTRALGTSDPVDDEESDLLRQFALPNARSYSISAGVRVSDDRERVLDKVYGISESTYARSSGFYFDLIDVRASSAADDVVGTGWVPGDDLDNAWWELHSPERPIGNVVIEQSPFIADEPVRRAQHARVLVDGRQVAAVPLSEDRVSLSLPQGTAGSVLRVEFDFEDDATGEATPPRMTIESGLTLHPTTGRCVPVALLDGMPLMLRPVSSSLPAGSVTASEWEGCELLDLPAGGHDLAELEGFTLDWLDLRDVQGLVPQQEAAPITAQVTSQGFASMRVDLPPSDHDVALVLGQAFDGRWVATSDDEDFGTALVMNGYSSGWVVPAGPARTLDLRYTPQRFSTVALVVSGTALLIAVVLVLLPSIARVTRRLAPVPVPAAQRELQQREGEPARLSQPPHDSRRAARLRWRGPRWGLGALVAGAFLGIGGLLGVLALMVLDRRTVGSRSESMRNRWLDRASRHPVEIGAFLVFGGILVYVAALWYQQVVPAAVIPNSLVAHTISAVGLTIALGHVLRRSEEELT